MALYSEINECPALLLLVLVLVLVPVREIKDFFSPIVTVSRHVVAEMSATCSWVYGEGWILKRIM